MNKLAGHHKKCSPNFPLLSAFRNELCINLARVVVSCLGVGEFRLGNLRSLLSPALVYSGKTPLSTLTGSANRFSVHQNKDGIAVRRTQDAHSQPTAALDRHIKGYILD